MPLALGRVRGSADQGAGDPSPGAGTAEGGLWTFCLPLFARPLWGSSGQFRVRSARQGGGGLERQPKFETLHERLRLRPTFQVSKMQVIMSTKYSHIVSDHLRIVKHN